MALKASRRVHPQPEMFQLEACNILTATPRALLVESVVGGETVQHWLPVSQLRDIRYGDKQDGPDDAKYTGSLRMTVWLAKNKGYIT